MKNNTKGFTLIELLVVVAIIGILASVALASLSGARDKAKVAAAIASLSSVRTEAERLRAVDGKLPLTATLCGVTTATPDVNITKLLMSAQKSIYPALTATGFHATVAAVDKTDGSFSGSCIVSTTDGYDFAVAMDISPKKSGGLYCVDSDGFAGELSIPMASTTSCK